MDRLYQKEWVVYAKQPFGGPEQVFAYLGRYTHRVGISNQRLVSFDGHDVCFRTKHGKTTTIPAVEFVRRFLLHVLPTRFVKIRHYGLVAAANVEHQARDRSPLPVRRSATTMPLRAAACHSRPSWRDLFLALTGIDLLVCPACGERAIERRPLRPHTTPARSDTS